MTPEGKVKVWLKKKLLADFPGIWIYKAPGGPFGQAGVSDFVCFWQGVLICIEAKADRTCKPTKLQLKFLNAIANNGGVAAVMKGKDETRYKMIYDAAMAQRHIIYRGQPIE